VDIADYERVSREIHILKIVQHPCVVQLYEIIETPKKLYLIMEYASGGELFDYIVKHQRVQEREACRFFQQLISGIEYLSRLNVVHRDLKPENLLIDYDKGIKIVDFGLSNTYKDGELLKTACGSPCYAAPEMIAGKKYNGTNVDIWSCGVILFALICGYLPFEDPNTSNLYKKILSADYQTPSFVSDEAKDLFSKILDTDPKRRLKIEEIRAHPWFNLVPCESTFKGIKVGTDPVPIDAQILDNMQTDFEI
jgi:5'-AMP-activated protein kinase catalytic alpha subunit